MAMFQPKITKARLVLSPFTSEQMLSIGNALSASIVARIKSGKNANDEAMKPLKGTTKGNYVPYAEQKRRRGLQPFRDWFFSGRTLRSLKVLSVNENAGKVGFTDSKANAIASYQNKIDRAFGISPTDRQAMNIAVGEVLRGGSVIQFRKVA